jgi:hypothetical protein
LFTLVEYASRRPDPHGQIRPVLAFFFVAVLLRWQERRQAARRRHGIFANKALPFFLCHPMWLPVSSNQIVELLLPGSCPWWTDNRGAFFIDFEASGAVPALESDGGSLVSCSPVGKEKDLIAFFFFLVRSFLHLPGTYVLFLYFMGSFVTYCTHTAWN